MGRMRRELRVRPFSVFGKPLMPRPCRRSRQEVLRDDEQPLQKHFHENSPTRLEHGTWNPAKASPICYSGPSGLRKSHSWKLKGPQLQRNCGPFASPFDPFKAHFWPLNGVDKIQTPDSQCFRNFAKIRVFAPDRSLHENIASREAEKQ